MEKIADMIVRMSQRCEVDAMAVLSKDKHKEVAEVRRLLIYVLHEKEGLSLNKVAKVLGLNVRSVSRRSAEVRIRLEHEKNYRAWYDEIVSDL